MNSNDLKKGRNCIIANYLPEVGNCYYTGIGWSQDREKSRRYSLPEVETVIENMRNDDEMAFWERYDKGRSSL